MFDVRTTYTRRKSTGPKVFLALPDACGLRPCDQTHLCHICMLVGRLTNTRCFSPHLSSYWVAFGGPCSPGHGSDRVWFGTGVSLRPQRTTPPGFFSLRRLGLLPMRPKVFLLPMRPKVFLALTDACGLRP